MAKRRATHRAACIWASCCVARSLTACCRGCSVARALQYAQMHFRAAHRSFRTCPKAQQLVVLTDGAAYNRSIAETHFPRAVHIIDLYHAREHLHELCKLLGFADIQKALPSNWFTLLDQGDIEKLLHAVEEHLPASESLRQQALKSLAYFRDHAEQMRYAKFRKKGFSSDPVSLKQDAAP